MKIIQRTYCLLRSVLVLIVLLSSCEYDFVEVEKPDKDLTISFKEAIQPIFEKQRCVTCHSSDYDQLDLSVDKAYQSIVPNLIDTLLPEQSKIYHFPNPGNVQHQFKKYTPSEAVLVLSWITQGANNN